MFDGWLKNGLAALGDVPAKVINPVERVYWPCLLAALVIAIVLAVRGSSGTSVKEIFNLSRQRKIWLHRTALVDYQIIFVKAFVGAVLYTSFAVVWTKAIAIAVIGQMTSWFGPAGANDWSRLQVTLLYTVVLFIFLDLSRFILHGLAHYVPFLWSFHQVHHSAIAMTPFTVARSHPVESFLFVVRGAVTIGLVLGVFWYFFQSRAVQIDILGVSVLGFAFNFAGANLRHSMTWFSYGPRLERWLLSPAQHQIHHSDVHPNYHMNLGACLAIWDRMFGTLIPAGKERDFEFGLPDNDCNHNPNNVLSCLYYPIVDSARRLAEIPSAIGKRLARAGK